MPVNTLCRHYTAALVAAAILTSFVHGLVPSTPKSSASKGHGRALPLSRREWRHRSRSRRALRARTLVSPHPDHEIAVYDQAWGDTSSAGHDKRLRQQNSAMVANLRGQLLQFAVASATLKRRIAVWVYLPPSYGNANQRFRVIYLLHGAPGTVRDCFVAARAHRVAESLILQKRIQPVILVGWDGHGPRGIYDVTNYLNRRNGTWQMEDFFIEELIPWVDSNFRTRHGMSSRAMIGFSAGGYGAVNMGLKYPGLFGVVASHAGFFDPSDDADDTTAILGRRSATWDSNNPTLRVRELPTGTRLHLYLDVGRADPLLHEFKVFSAALRVRQIDCETHIFPGEHTPAYLHQHYADSMRFVDERFREMEVNEALRRSR